jgi:hypothetical protein
MEDWESTCRITKVMQEDTFGCGVACLAMVAKIYYAEAKRTFIKHGLDSENRPDRRKPFATIFQQLIRVLDDHTPGSKKEPWRGWDRFEGVGIIKVECRPKGGNGDWHWVVAEKHDRFDVVVHDPYHALPSFRKRPPEGVECDPFENHVSCGDWIRVPMPLRGLT